MNNKKLTIDELFYVHSEVNRKQKSVFGSYALAILLGPIGVHRAYLGKFKSGLARAALTIITLAVLLTAVTTVDIAGVDTATLNDVLVYNAVIALLLIGLATANVIWSIIDLLSIPKWIKETEETHENIAAEKAIQSRYVAEDLLRKGISENLYKEVKKEVTESISSEVNEKLKKLNLRQDVEFRPKHTLPSYEYCFGTQEEFDLETAFCKQAQEYENQISIDDLFPEEILEEQIEDVQNIPEDLIEAFNDTKESQQGQLGELEDQLAEEDDPHFEFRRKVAPIDLVEQEPTTEVSQNDTEELSLEKSFSLSEFELTSVDEAINKEYGESVVKGYIVGYVDPNTQKIVRENFESDFNIAIADTPYEIDTSKMIFVRMSWESKLRSKVGLQSNPEHLGKEVMIVGTLEEYFGEIGLKKVGKIAFIDSLRETVFAEHISEEYGEKHVELEDEVDLQNIQDYEEKLKSGNVEFYSLDEAGKTLANEVTPDEDLGRQELSDDSYNLEYNNNKDVAIDSPETMDAEELYFDQKNVERADDDIVEKDLEETDSIALAKEDYENLLEDVGLEDIDFSGYEKRDEQKHASFGDKPLEEKCEYIAKESELEDIEVLEKQLIESLVKKEDHCAPEEQVVDTNTQWENENTLQWKDNQSYEAQHETNTDIDYEKETISEDFNLSLDLDIEEDDDKREIPNFVSILNFDSEEDEETDDALLENEETLPEAEEMPKEIIVNEEKYNERKERAVKRSKQTIGDLVNKNDKKSKKKKDKKEGNKKQKNEKDKKRGNFLFFRKRSKTKA